MTKKIMHPISAIYVLPPINTWGSMGDRKGIDMSYSACQHNSPFVGSLVNIYFL